MEFYLFCAALGVIVQGVYRYIKTLRDQRTRLATELATANRRIRVMQALRDGEEPPTPFRLTMDREIREEAAQILSRI